MSETFEFTIGDKAFEWNYAHTVNVWDIRYGGDPYAYIPLPPNHFYNPNCFSLNYARDDYTKAEVMEYALDWLEESNSLE